MTGTFALFDMTNFLTPAKRLAPPLLFVLVLGVITPWPAVAIGGAAIVMSLLAPNPFAADERGRLDTLYATLPITRRTVVVGRYIALVALYLGVALLATIAAVVIPLVEGKAVATTAVLAEVDAAGFVLFAVALAVQLPFFFSVGFTRARPMMYIPVAVLAAACWVASETGMLDHVSVLSVSSLNPAVLWAPGLVVAVVALVVSAAISSTRYARRAL